MREHRPNQVQTREIGAEHILRGIRTMPCPTSEKINNILITDVLSYWRSLAPRDSIPFKDAFDPLGLRPLALPRVFLIDILAEERSYRLRLQGTYLVNAYGVDFTGRYMNDSEIPNVTKSRTYRLLHQIVASGEPQYDMGPTSFRFTDYYTDVEQVVMPLTDRSGRITHVVGAVDYPGYSPLRH